MWRCLVQATSIVTTPAWLGAETFPAASVAGAVNAVLGAVGAYEALKAVGKEKDVLIVSVDGGCAGSRTCW